MAETTSKEAPAAAGRAGLWTRITNSLPFLGTKKGLATAIIIILVIIGGGLAGLAALPRNKGGQSGGSSSGSGSNPNAITSDTYFYGQSPEFLPSPNMTGTGTWAESLKKAQSLVSQMTLDEKISLTSGTTSDTGCVGYLPSIPRLNFTGMCFQDAGQGVRATDFVSAWPAGIHMGASWNRDLSRERALGMGAEFRTKGINVHLGPVIGPLGRTVTSGRIWEGIAVDPYLSGALAYETVQGVQAAGVITSTKHYIANEQESYRMPSGNVSAVSSNIDDQTMHEFYLWPFQDAVRAGTGNIMCSYQRINNSYGCSNSYTLNGLLKTELGFQGFVVTDWGAQHAGVATALAGTDVAMPNDGGFWGSDLSDAVTNGSVPESRLDDMVTRILAPWYQLGQDQGFPKPGVGLPADLRKPHTIVDARNSSFKSTLFDGAVEGHVLVKNIRNALPLNKPKMLSVFGYSARSPGTFNIEPSGGFVWTYGANSADTMSVVAGFAGSLTYPYLQIAPNGTIWCGGGSGANAAVLGIAPMDSILQRAYADGTAVSWDFLSGSPFVDGASDACLVFGNAWANEGSDRPGIHDDYTDGLIQSVASECNNTIVILHNAGVRLVDQWADHENVTAIIFAHLPGQESGNALVSLLYGESNPSGKLPYTVAHNESDYGDLLEPAKAEGIFERYPQANFTEGLYIDYRSFDAKNITPRYEFGFGLSYTTFKYSNLVISKTSSANSTSQYTTGDVVEGGPSDLWDVLVNVTADVQNTGDFGGAEIAQLYIGLPAGGSERPVRQLRGFDKPFINATQTATVSFGLTRRDLSVWDTVAQKWALQSGTYTVFVGSSSRNLPLNGTFDI